MEMMDKAFTGGSFIKIGMSTDSCKMTKPVFFPIHFNLP